MDPRLRNRCTLSILLVALLPAAAAAQVVPLRTVPIPAGEQFLIGPSRTLGMGGAMVALDDPWGDPFVNPAKGARSERLRFFSMPAAYAADGSGGGGATFPVAFLARHGRLFGGAGLAVQSPDDPNVNYYNGWRFTQLPPGQAAPPPLPSGVGAPTNRYGYGVLGWTLADGRTSLGLGLGGSKLEQMDGVERLFPNRVWISQSGRTADVRAGVLRELAGGASLEALALASRIDMRYDVGRIEYRYVYNAGPPPRYVDNTRSWIDHNRDVSRTYGLHLRYVGARDTSGIRVGYIATVNKKDYPVLPNYDIAPVPRDPGDSWAFQAGIGMSRERGRRTSALELVLEPAWSHTWATAPAQTDAAGVLTPETVTSENFFHFYNAHAVAGFERRTDWGSYQYGLRLDEIHYSLSRQDFATGRNIDSSDGWLEWTPTWGVAVRAGPVDLRYAGHLTFKNFPLDWGESKTVVQPNAFPGGDGVDFLPPAVGSSTREFWTAAHQFTISVPVGGAR